MAEFLQDDPYDGGPRSSVAGVAEPGNLANNANINGQAIQGKNVVRFPPIKTAASARKLEAIRQHYLKVEKDNFPSWLHMHIMEAGYNKIDKPYTNTKINDLREGNKPDGYFSATLVWAMIAGAKALPYASDAQMQLLAQNSDHEPTRKSPALDIDDAA